MNYGKFLLVIALSWLVNSVSAQSSPTTLDVVSWNLEFFGDISNGPADNDLQEANAKKIMRYLDADIYGLCEIVDSMRLRRLVDSLGTNFGYKLADYCSNNTTGTGPSWLNGQKLAFIYKKDHFNNLTIRGFMRSSPTAYTNFASGRFPYLLNADVTVNGFTRNINFFMLHGKAGATASDFTRRRDAAIEMKDSIDQQFPNSINLVIGDYNDALHMTISTGGVGPESSYDPIVEDSLDANHYRSITIPLGYLGQSSMINFPNVIDNHIVSNEAMPYYIPASAQIRTDVTAVVPDYVSAHNTSDHWPVFSNYNLSGIVTGLPGAPLVELGIQCYPNPFREELFLKAGKPVNNLFIQLSDLSGRIIYSNKYSFIQPGTIIKPSFPVLGNGIYVLQFITPHSRSFVKLVRL